MGGVEDDGLSGLSLVAKAADCGVITLTRQWTCVTRSRYQPGVREGNIEEGRQDADRHSNCRTCTQGRQQEDDDHPENCFYRSSCVSILCCTLAPYLQYRL